MLIVRVNIVLYVCDISLGSNFRTYRFLIYEDLYTCIACIIFAAPGFQILEYQLVFDPLRKQLQENKKYGFVACVLQLDVNMSEKILMQTHRLILSSVKIGNACTMEVIMTKFQLWVIGLVIIYSLQLGKLFARKLSSLERLFYHKYVAT